MVTTLKHRLAVLGAAAIVATSPLLIAPSSADAAASLVCRASMSDATPGQYSNVYVRVKTAPRASVKTTAHYRTTNTTYRRKADNRGKASVRYYTSSATAGYRVEVDVTVSKNGRTKHCSTSFRPHS